MKRSALRLAAIVLCGVVGLGVYVSLMPGNASRSAGRHITRPLVSKWLSHLVGGGDVRRAARCTGYERLLRRDFLLKPGPSVRSKSTGARNDVKSILRRVDPRMQIKTIARRVQAIRGHRFATPVRPKFLEQKDFVYRFADPGLGWLPASGYELQARLLSTLGAMFSSTDLQELSHAATSRGLAGLYFPGNDRLFVRAKDSGSTLTPVEEVTLAHELDHALMDQSVGFPERSVASGGEDADLAARALIEGSATLTMHRYASSALSRRYQVAVLRNPRDHRAPTAELHRLPHYLQREGRFPYVDGLRFVCDLFRRGGWDAVDHAFESPPTTSAQVLFPDRYRRREGAVQPHALGSLPAPWIHVRTQAFGAASLMWLLEAPGGEPSRGLDHPLQRAAGWAGGELSLWIKGRQTSVGLALVQHKGQRNLCKSVRGWYRAGYPGAQRHLLGSSGTLAANSRTHDAVIACRAGEVRLGMAPHLSLARSLVGN